MDYRVNVAGVNNTIKTLALAAIATVFVTAQANAFSGSIFMDGKIQTKQVGVKNTIKFTKPWAVLGTPAPDGAYSGVPTGTAVTFTTFTYNVNTLAITSPATTPFLLWTFAFGGNTYSFKLDSPLTGAASSSKSVILSGTGTGFINGKDPSDAVWSLESTGGGGFKFTATASTSAVPDGGSAVALLGIAIIAILGLGRLIIRVTYRYDLATKRKAMAGVLWPKK